MTDETDDTPYPEILTTPLLPCPFCGHAPGIMHLPDFRGVEECQIECENPMCGIVCTCVRQSFEEAARAWNNRL